MRLGFWPLTTLLICANNQLCLAKWVKGVLWGENGGEGANPVRTIELAVGNDVYALEYAPRFFKPHFRTQTCWEVGAIWTVQVTKLEDLGELIKAACTGQMDAWAHEPAILIKKYLNDLAKGSATALVDVSSVRWKSSSEFENYRTQSKHLDLSFYRTHGRAGGCLEIIKIERPLRTEVRSAECGIERHRNLVNLIFTVVRNTEAQRWEIDQIKIE